MNNLLKIEFGATARFTGSVKTNNTFVPTPTPSAPPPTPTPTPPAPPTAFWSGWTSEPTSYISDPLNGAGVDWTVDGTDLYVAPRSGLHSFNSNYEYLGGTIDASNCTNLNTLNCTYAQITEVNISGCINLADLYLSSNQLTELNFSESPLLKNVHCSGNQLSVLDVSGLSQLTILFCGSNQLSVLDVSGHALLNRVACQNNLLSSLNVSGSVNLTTIACGYNQLTEFDISGLTSLNTLYCHENNLTQTAVDGILTTMDSFNTIGAAYSYILLNGGTNAAPSSIGLAAKANLESRGFIVTVNDESGPETPFWSGWSIEPEYISTPANGEGVDWTVADTDLYVSPRNSLTDFSSSSPTGGSIDAKSSSLNDLTVSYVEITSLDVSQAPALTRLHCRSNFLTSLDLSNLMSLRQVVCQDNQLTSLNASNCYSMNEIICYDNQLPDIIGFDGIGLTSLNSFYGYNNQFTEAAVNNILIRLDNISVFPSVVLLDGTGNAAPTGAGLTAKASLQAKGTYVTTN